jgi:hypothetical protein
MPNHPRRLCDGKTPAALPGLQPSDFRVQVIAGCSYFKL